MKERERLQHAISIISAQRILLGNAVVDTTIAAMREKLAALEASDANHIAQRTAQRKQITILFANVTGITNITHALPDTNMLDIMNLLWQRLDNAITNQGGVIDKHIGDAVMGLFGVPAAREDDPERAIRAALAMRAALSEFVKELNAQIEPTPQSSRKEEASERLPALQLRVGINTGPVLLGGIGSGDEYTVIGDAVNVASRLERAAPGGGILISHDTYLLVRGIFETESLGPVTIKGKSDPVPVYLALGAKPRRSFLSSRGVEGVETHMVGRDREMRLLQQDLETAVTTGTGKIITIVGEAGVGKSRLMQEFNDWLQGRPQELPAFKGQADQRMSQRPYALIRNMLSAHFDIQDSDSPRLVEEKLIRGMSELIGRPHIQVKARAQTIGHLIGLNLPEKNQLPVSPTESPQVRHRAYGYLIELFKQVVDSTPAALMILEDVHWADEASLDLLDHLSGICQHAPLLILCLTRPSLFERRTSWGKTDDEDADGETAVPQTILHLHPLTEAESHQLVTDILQKLPEIPEDLCSLIVEKAEGNPFYVEELIKVFIEDGYILTGQEKWQIQSTHLSAIRVPSTLTGVLQARLDRLSELERATLQRAAVIGRLFWDSAVIHMNELAADPFHSSETVAALQALEKRELIFKRHTAIFTGTQSYYFKHAILREVTYESVLLRDRPIFHKLAADWLAQQSGERIAEYADLIAEHFELAGEKTQAAELYEMAAQRAQNMSDPDGAIQHYGRALSLLSEQAFDTTWQLRLQRKLGQLLQQTARLIEAAQTYMTMRFTAEIDGDLAIQAHAWNGLARVHQKQGRFTDMLESASQAEQVAWLVSAETELTQALLCKSQAHLYLGDTELAAAAANRALTISDSQHNMVGTIQSLSQLCWIYIKSGRHNRARLYLDELADQLDLPDLDSATVALNRTEQGRLLRQLEHYDKAAHELIAAQNLYRQIDDQPQIAATLNQLGELARLRGNPAAAMPLFKEALDIAEAVGYRYASLFYRTNLGGALARAGKLDMAEAALNAVITQATNVSRVANWIELHRVYRFLAYVYLANNQLDKALDTARRTLSLLSEVSKTKASSATWRILGQIGTKLPPAKLPIIIDDKPYDVPACFAESLKQLQALSGKSVMKREQALTLAAWAAYELQKGEKQLGVSLKEQAQALATQLGLELSALI